MKSVRYILLDPTGNLTCLVLDPVEKEERPRVTSALMSRCEQVGYLMGANLPGAAARLEMMGGEFCGNASMATAVYLAETYFAQDRTRAWLQNSHPAKNDRCELTFTEEKQDTVPETEVEIPLEVSGAEGIVRCTARREQDGWIGSAAMPLPREVREIEIRDKKLTAVCFPGMTHLIRQGERMERQAAEALILQAAEEIPEPALGLLQWDSETGTMVPLVYVRDSGTLVWETACGSGTAAIAAMESMRAGKGMSLAVHQPGGVIQAETRVMDEKVERIVLRGMVRMGQEELLSI